MEEKYLLIVSGIIFALLLMVGLLSGSIVLLVNLVFLGVVVVIVPYSLNKFFQFKKIKSYEDEFPNFLRDLAESQRAGLTLMQAIQSSAKSEYGLLTHEIRKMNNQLSWNIPMDVVLQKFSKRMGKSKTIVRSMAVIEQANKSGGSVEDTMDSLAGNIESLKDVQHEKSVALNQQVMMMYAIFFIFLGITIALIKFLVPVLQTQTQAGTFAVQGFSANPCAQCIGSSDPVCLGCQTFFTVATAFDFGPQEDAGAYYKALFFTMILVQGFFSGLIAGQIGSDSVTAGVKHSMIMLVAGFSIFMLTTRIGFI